MSSTPAIVVPAGKDAPPTPPPSISDKVAAAFKTEAPPAMPKAPTPPAKAPDPTPAAATIPPPPAIPSLLSRKVKLEPVTATPAPEPAPGPLTDPNDPDARYSLPANASPDQVSQFTELKREARARYNKIKELEAKLTSPAVPAPEVQKLRDEHKAAMDRLAIVDLQSHPDFKRQYQEPKIKALGEVKEILTYSGKEGTNLEGLLSKDRKDFNAAVTDLTKDLNAMDATTVQTALRDAYRVSQEEKTALSKAGEIGSALSEQSKAQARQAFEEVSSNLGPMGEFLVTLDIPDGATADEKQEIAEYNQEVMGVRNKVEKTVFGKADEKSLALLGWKGATLDFLLTKGVPRMEKTYLSLVEERNALARELSAIKGAKGSGPIAGDPAKGGMAPKTVEEMVAAAYRK